MGKGKFSLLNTNNILINKHYFIILFNNCLKKDKYNIPYIQNKTRINN